MSIKPYTYIVRFDIAPLWMADGYTMSDQRALEMLGHDLASANMSFELAARVLSAPSVLRIAREQGYHGKHPQSGAVVRQIIADAPHAYRLGTQRPATLDAALCDAIALLDAKGLGDYAAAAKLRDVLSLLRGDSPISDIEWSAAE